MVTPVVRLSRQLGEGGMGSIWLADHLSLKAPVVVKFMSPLLASNSEAIERFSREAMAAAQLRSPHVVQVFDHGVTDGVPYIVMELLEGRDLSSLIRERGRLDPAALVHIVSQVCKALTKAHGMGITHRDIKPENIFVCGNDDEPFVKLLDFGIAKTSGPSASGVATRTGAILGTPLYMSPEQIATGKDVDARADIWAMGVVVFEALTGTKPFIADDFGALVLMLHTGPTPRPTSLDATLPPAIDDWFARACHRQVEHRFATIGEMLAALRIALQVRIGSDPSVREPGPAAAPPEVDSARSATVAAPIPPFQDPRAAIAPVTNGGLATTAASIPLRKPTGLWVGAAAVLVVALGVGALALRAAKTKDGSGRSESAAAGLVAPPSSASGDVSSPGATTAASDPARPAATAPAAVLGSSGDASKTTAVAAPHAATRAAGARAGTAVVSPPAAVVVSAGPGGAAAAPDAGASPALKPPADPGKPRPRFNDIE